MQLAANIADRTPWLAARLAVVRRSHAALAAIIALASAMRLYDLGHGHPGLAIYSAISKNAYTSFDNWLYPSVFVDGSFLADKPPVFFWIQGAFIAVLGPSNIALRLPAALTGIASVILLFVIVRRLHGTRAGLASALVMATMPMDANFSRGVFLEPVTTLTMLVAAYFVVRAVQERREGFFYVASAVVGLAFMVKLWQGLLPVPAFALMALFHRWTPWPRFVRTAAVCTAIALASGLWWPTMVWLTAGSYDAVMHSSSVWDMIFGWNLLDRFGGLEYGGTSYRQDPLWFVTGPLGVFFGIALIPGALIGIAMLARRRALGQAVLWLAWLGVAVAGFGPTSVKLASYWASVTPAVAALSGVGFVFMAEDRSRMKWLWPLLLLIAAVGFVYYAYAFGLARTTEGPFALSEFVGLLLALGFVIFAGTVVIQTVFPGFIGKREAPSLFVPAAIWVAIVLLNAQVAAVNILAPRTDTLGRIGFDMITVPSSEPERPIQTSRPRLRGAVITAIVRVEPENLDAALEYIQQNRGDSRYVLAADSYNTAARVALLTGKPVLPLYSEYQDTRVTDIDTLDALVHGGDVRFVLTSPLMQYMDRVLFSWMLGHAAEDLTNRFGLPRDEMRLLRIAR
ncbi:MAG TPA: hypothetical protein DCP37_06300 [Dehalococcoidia bacterium]|nr:glycosyltransferase family 39 protein [SAR202 cluster bacterium]MDP6664221.1 glycosyltransferase family 39 protein [SAR202 cluster bacterium]MDP6799407.1 glycosyltransferase family 39 protein [SAR202 cluster bacterium]MQG57931.1 hypothetical protein [SAR202 cluster bacterium]HAL47349.1 hypothetical protein [Dehalococcoidia bacterium]